jgi:hypothetical protein
MKHADSLQVQNMINLCVGSISENTCTHHFIYSTSMIMELRFRGINEYVMVFGGGTEP